MKKIWQRGSMSLRLRWNRKPEPIVCEACGGQIKTIQPFIALTDKLSDVEDGDMCFGCVSWLRFALKEIMEEIVK